jgi:TRAP-type C4-dicarboxylate transport system permease small subunit
MTTNIAQTHIGTTGEGYISAIRKTGRACHYAAAVLLFLLMSLGAGEVIARFVFNRPIVAVLELSQIMQAMMVFMAWAYTTASRSHVRVEILIRRFSPRVQAIQDFVTAIIVIILFALVAWKATEKAVFYWENNMQVDVLFIPLAPFQLFLAVGAVLLSLELIAQMLELIPLMKGGR